MGDFLSLGRKGGSLDDTGISRVPAPLAARADRGRPISFSWFNYFGLCCKDTALAGSNQLGRSVGPEGLSFGSPFAELRLSRVYTRAQSRFTDWLSLTIA